HRVRQSRTDERIPKSISGGPDAAMEILGTVAAFMVSLAALVLTITMVVVQLAMGQFSPRIVQRILQDKPSQLAIGIFVATFAHAMLAMREIDFDGGGQVPGVAIIVAFAMVLIRPSARTWRSVRASSSTSRSARSQIPRYRTLRRQCRPSIGCTTASGSWLDARSPPATTETRTGRFD